MMGNFRGMAKQAAGAPTGRGAPGSIMSAYGGGGGGGRGGGMGGMFQRLRERQQQRGGGQPQPDPRVAQFNRENPMPGGGSRMVTGGARDAYNNRGSMGRGNQGPMLQRGGGGGGRSNMMQRQMAQAQGMRGGMGRSGPQRMGGGMKPQPPRGGMRPPNPTGGRARMGGRGGGRGRGRGMYR